MSGQGTSVRTDVWSPENVLVDMVDLTVIRAENRLLRTPGGAAYRTHRSAGGFHNDQSASVWRDDQSPGRLADYRRQFEKMTRSAGDDPSIFAIALETLAVKAFGDMGQTARLRLIRDRFVAGHSSCELRRYLDSVPPETPIRDVVDRCRVWESHTDPEI